MQATASILRRLCFVDIETTGLDPSTDQIVEIGAVFVERGVVTARRHWLVRPGKPVPALITALTGITDEELAGAETFAELEPRLRDALAGWTLVAHNAGFERSFLGEVIAGNAVLDSCEVAQLLAPDRSSHSLDALVRWLDVGRGARHRALDDAEDTFLMLAALCDHVLASGARARLERVRFHLASSSTRDRGALTAFLEDLLASPPTVQRVPASPGATAGAEDLLLVHRLARWLEAPERVCAELERDGLLPAAIAAGQRAARSLGSTVAVAVSSGTFRELSDRVEAPALARRAVCRGALRSVLAEPVDDEEGQFARAYLSSWLERTRTGDVEGISGFVRARFPVVVALLDAATSCRCDDARCFARQAVGDAPCVLITHDHALDWAERGVPAPILFLEADRLPEVERRRHQRTVDVTALEPFGDVGELRRALQAFPSGPVSMRQRAMPEWHAVREALSNLGHALRAAPVDTTRARLLERLAQVMEPPPPGFEVLVSAKGLVRQPALPGDQLARRLGRGHCLVSSFKGGLQWTRASPVSAETQRSAALLEWSEAPVSPDALVELLRKTRPAVLVAPGPLAPLAEACRRSGLSISLDAERSADVQLCEWRRDRELPSAAACVFYGVREWRRAVLSTRASRVLLLSPTGLQPGPLARALVGLGARPLTC